MPRLHAIFFLLFLSAVPVIAQPAVDPCDIKTGASDVTFRISFADGQTNFREGEIIPVHLVFSTTSHDIQFNTSNYDRSGRLEIEHYCVEPSAPYPYESFYSFGGFMGGGIFSIGRFDDKPFTIDFPLNDWHRFKPGHYSMRVVSNRIVRPTPDRKPSAGPPAISNTVEFDVIEATPAWSAAELSAALAIIDRSTGKEQSGSGEPEVQHAVDVVRFLDTEEAIRAMASRLPLGSNAGFYFHRAVVSSLHPQVALAVLLEQLTDPQVPVTGDLLDGIARLKMAALPPLPPFDKNREAELRKIYMERQDVYDKYFSEAIRETTQHLASKRGAAKAITAQTLLSSLNRNSDLSLDQNARTALIASFDQLPLKKRREELVYRWDEIKGPEAIPLLRRTLAETDHSCDGARTRAALVANLYQIDKSAGREAVIAEMLNTNDCSGTTLAVLPDKTLPELEPRWKEKLADGNLSSADYDLLARYGSAALLPEIKAKYESFEGTWACQPQSALFRYLLKFDSDYAAKKINAAFYMRKDTGCFREMYSNLGENVPLEIEKAAIAALNDPDVEAVRGAAAGLKNFGSEKRSLPALWQRLEQFHKQWEGHERDFDAQYPFQKGEIINQVSLQQGLASAIASGQGWYCGSDCLNHLTELLVGSTGDYYKGQAKSAAAGEFTLIPNYGSLASFEVAQYDLGTFDALIAKLSQFPAGTRIRFQFFPRGAPGQDALFERLTQEAPSNVVIVKQDPY
jgi:hypothetical protein